MPRMAPAPSPRTRERLRAAELFENLSDSDLDRFLEAGELLHLGPGDYLFRPGDPPHRMFVLLDGVVEILRPTSETGAPVPVRYLTTGESLGDMGLFTRGPRKSTGRVPERAEVLVLDGPAFRRLAESIPGFGLHVAAVFARRMDRFVKQVRKHSRRELSGKVQYFDLATVLQTLIATSQTGVLGLLGTGEHVVGEILLVEGRVIRARCDLLEGDEAFFHVFCRQGITEFVFRTMTDPAPNAISDVPIVAEPMNLLLEAVREVDEMARAMRRLPDPHRAYQARSAELVWPDERTVIAAAEILGRLEQPRPIEDLVGVVPCPRSVLYKVAAALYESGQIA